MKFRRRCKTCETYRRGHHAEFGEFRLELLLHLKRFRLKSCVGDYFMNIWWIKIKIFSRGSRACIHATDDGSLVQRIWKKPDNIDRSWQSQCFYNIFRQVQPNQWPFLIFDYLFENQSLHSSFGCSLRWNQLTKVKRLTTFSHSRDTKVVVWLIRWWQASPWTDHIDNDN